MKRAALRALIERMENQVDDDHFRMNSYVTPVDQNTISPGVYSGEKDIPYCKTAGCIAGQVFLGLTPEERQKYKGMTFTAAASLAAKDTLDIDNETARALFEPGAYWRITRETALKALKGIETNSVLDWKKAISDGGPSVPDLLWYAEYPIPINLD